MLNMNSPTVQNLIQSGFNPYNNGYIPQQQQMSMQQNYYNYNPYMQQQPVQYDNNFEYYYDPMPNVIVNENRGINTQMAQTGYSNQSYNNPYYNNQAFNGYMNPYLMQNQIEADRIRQREEAIQQGRIWRTLLKNEEQYDENFDLESTIQRVESLYYYEPIKEEMTMKERIVVDKNKHIAELECRTQYYKQNNIPIIDNRTIMLNNFSNYYNHLNEIIGDVDNCDMVDYFRRVYPEMKFEQLSYEAERYNKNLKNRYDSKEFNKLIDREAKDRPDSYYYKLMETFGDSGVKLETSNGLVITPDEMEVKIPQRLLKNRQDLYYEQRKKFYDAIFNKEGQ